ncbi:MAG: hypothetical protein FLDDKLPJ_01918 [Phycisphaerae bacterium]|nr:hypothetical protein [Phycisphaerae bacterium]
MSPEHPIGDSQELAALYAAGAMSPAESAEFEHHLVAGCERCRSQLLALSPVIEHLAAGSPDVTPGPDVKGRILSRIAKAPTAHIAEPAPAPSPQVWKNWSGEDEVPGWYIKRHSETDWQSIGIEGIHVRRLFLDPERNQITMLVRMAPGAEYPRHIHDGPEECLVLEGDLYAGDTVFRKGDYQRMSPGSRHAVQGTRHGCLLLIVSSLSDELEHD